MKIRKFFVKNVGLTHLNSKGISYFLDQNPTTKG